MWKLLCFRGLQTEELGVEIYHWEFRNSCDEIKYTGRLKKIDSLRKSLWRLNTRQTVGCGIPSSVLAVRVDLRGPRSKLFLNSSHVLLWYTWSAGAFVFTQTAYLLKLVIPSTNALPRWRLNVERKTKRTPYSGRRLSFNELTNAENLVLHSSHFALNWRCCTALDERSSGGVWKFRTSSYKCYVDHSHNMFSSGNVFFKSPCITVLESGSFVYWTTLNWRRRGKFATLYEYLHFSSEHHTTYVQVPYFPDLIYEMQWDSVPGMLGLFYITL